MHRFMKQATLGAAVLGLAAAGASLARAEEDTQGFTSQVAAVLSITAPADVTEAHPGTDADHSFATQEWIAESNNAAGATVDFSVTQAFTHTTDSSHKRDVRLTLALASSDAGSGWAVDVGGDTDQTDHDGADETASVTAQSDDAGNATFDLDVDLMTDNFSTLAAGDYETTVTGTIAAK